MLLLSTYLATIFATSMGVLIGLVYVLMGATIDFEVVKGIAKKPIGPVVGIVCQYGGMPVVSESLGSYYFRKKSDG